VPRIAACPCSSPARGVSFAVPRAKSLSWLGIMNGMNGLKRQRRQVQHGYGHNPYVCLLKCGKTWQTQARPIQRLFGWGKVSIVLVRLCERKGRSPYVCLSPGSSGVDVWSVVGKGSSRPSCPGIT
jgi:hypothetical protein